MKSSLTAITIAGLAILAGLVLYHPNLEAQKKIMGTEKFKSSGNYSLATFAGGCFWCMEKPFDVVEGVISTTSGYTGGKTEAPSYDEVCTGFTGHTEAIVVEFDPAKVSYEKLLEVYWRNVDPTTPNRQFCDTGTQYRPEIFYHDDAQREAAEATKAELLASGRFEKVAVEITKAADFWVAEDYHQNFYKKKPDHYNRYREGCGRDERLEKLWGKLDH